MGAMKTQPMHQGYSLLAIVLLMMLLGFAALYVPSYVELARHVWPSDEQGHGPIILALGLWLLKRGIGLRS